MKFWHILLALLPLSLVAKDLVILHTNDTHSAIDADRNGNASILQRKALIDSVRTARANKGDVVMLVDAGDAVQGSLYFTLYRGEVERRLMNMMDYDIQILGNHEFDNGMEGVRDQWSRIDAAKLSTNYKFSDSLLSRLFVPAIVKDIDGKKIAFLGVNLNPKGMIAPANIEGVEYLDAISTADEQAHNLKSQGADMVIALTHLGYETDTDADDVRLARQSHDIDLIIGGHSHTLLNPAVVVTNAKGQPVTIVQTGSRGQYVGEIEIDLDDKKIESELLTATARLNDRIDQEVAQVIGQYRAGVDSLRTAPVGYTYNAFDRKAPETLNMLTDFVRRQGVELTHDPVDVAILNKGGIRSSLPQGIITAGSVIDMQPFDNRIVVMDILGNDLLENIAIMKSQDGNGISGNFSFSTDGTPMLDGKPIQPNATYRLATIDYLANGGDYMTPLTRGKLVAETDRIMYQSLLDAIKAGRITDLLLYPDRKQRM